MNTTETTIDDSPLLSREQASDWLKVSTRTLDDLIAQGELPATRIRRRVFVHRDDLRQYIDAQRQCA